MRTNIEKEAPLLDDDSEKNHAATGTISVNSLRFVETAFIRDMDIPHVIQSRGKALAVIVPWHLFIGLQRLRQESEY
jgi:hypothetical protein